MSRTLCASFAIGALLCASAASRAGDRAELEALFAKAIKAAGGEAKVGELKAFTCKGSASFQENGIQIMLTFDLAWQGWDQLRLDADAQIGGMSEKGLLVINGDKGWTRDNVKSRPIPKEDLPWLRHALAALRLPHMAPALRDKAFKLSSLGEIKIGDRPALGVLVAHADRKDVSLYFDKESGLPAKVEVQITAKDTEVAVEYLFSEYKEFNGLKHPSKVVIKAAGKEFTLELSEVRAQAQLDAALFAEP